MLEIRSSRTLFLPLPYKIIVMKKIITFIFGERAQGEMITQPTLRSTYPANRLDENQWYQELQVSSKYGTRGSFYRPR